MTRRAEETKLIKEALKSLPYRVKVRHGTGTGSGWIKAYIPKAVWENERQTVEDLIAKATNRPNYYDYNHIIVNWYE